MWPCPPPRVRRVRGLSAARARSGRKRTLLDLIFRWIVAATVALVWMKERRKTPMLANGCAKSVREPGRKRKGSPLAAGRNRVPGLRLVNSKVIGGKQCSLDRQSMPLHGVRLTRKCRDGVCWARMSCGQSTSRRDRTRNER